MRPSAVVWLAAAAFATVFGTASMFRHRAFGTGRFDLGNMTQAVWSTANGDSRGKIWSQASSQMAARL